MKSASPIIILIAACLIPVASRSEKKCPVNTEAIPLCTAIADASQYDGKDITVGGIYYKVIHGSILTSSGCPKTKVNMRLAQDWKGDKQAIRTRNSLTSKNQGTDVVLRGTFRVARQGCFGQTCSLYEIEEHELLCAARRESRDDREQVPQTR